MKKPLGMEGMEVELSPGHIVLGGDAVPSPCERGTAAPSFWPTSVVATFAHFSCWALVLQAGCPSCHPTKCQSTEGSPYYPQK